MGTVPHQEEWRNAWGLLSTLQGRQCIMSFDHLIRMFSSSCTAYATYLSSPSTTRSCHKRHMQPSAIKPQDLRLTCLMYYLACRERNELVIWIHRQSRSRASGVDPCRVFRQCPTLRVFSSSSSICRRPSPYPTWESSPFNG